MLRFVSLKELELFVELVALDPLFKLPELELEVEGVEFIDELGEFRSFVLVIEDELDLFIRLALLPDWLVAADPVPTPLLSGGVELISPVSFFAHPAKMVKLAIIKANFFIFTPFCAVYSSSAFRASSNNPHEKKLIRFREFTRSRTSVLAPKQEMQC